MLNRCGERRQPYLIINIRRTVLSLLPLSMIAAVGFSQMSFIKLRKVPCIPSLLKIYITNTWNQFSQYINCKCKIIFLSAIYNSTGKYEVLRGRFNNNKKCKIHTLTTTKHLHEKLKETHIKWGIHIMSLIGNLSNIKI